MFRDFYATMAQVLPLLLLALMWDSGYLGRLRHQRRLPRRLDPHGVRFWTKPRVRAYSLTVTVALVGGTAVAVLVLGGLVPDSPPLRALLSGAALLALGTLTTRISVDVIAATAEAESTPAASPGPDDGGERESPPFSRLGDAGRSGRVPPEPTAPR